MVYLGEVPAPLIGRISMDLVTIDVTDVPETAIHVGAMATVIGLHRDLDTVAAEAGTIAYEVTAGLGQRVARVYRESGTP
jgi:alanine racemase